MVSVGTYYSSGGTPHSGKDILSMRTIANPFLAYFVLTRARNETLEVIKDLFISRRLLVVPSLGKVRDRILVGKASV